MAQAARKRGRNKKALKRAARKESSSPSRAVQAIGLLLVVFAAYVSASLLSYDSGDPSLNRAAAERAVNNVGGMVGAIIADISIQVIGIAAIGVIAILVAWGWRLLSDGRTIGLTAIRVCSLFISVTAFSLLATYIPSIESWPSNAGMGGAMGAIIKENLSSIAPDYAIFAGALLVFLATLPVALGLRRDEWKAIYSLLRKFMKSVGKVFSVIYSMIRSAGEDISFSSGGHSDKGDVLHCATPPQSYSAEEELREFATKNNKKKEKKRSWSLLGHIGKRTAAGDDLADEYEYESSHGSASAQGSGARGNIVAGTETTKEETKVSRNEYKEQKQTFLGLQVKLGSFEMPPYSLLLKPPSVGRKRQISDSLLKQNAKMLESVLADFGVKGKIINIRPGPVVTLYELEPSAGTKSARVIGLADDIARSMSAVSARISVISGRNAIGIELPNAKRDTVYMREIIESDKFRNSKMGLPIALGKDIAGESVIVDLAKMPHLLVAGTTGSGKSVGINTMIASLLYHYPPEQCKFIMIDPKMLELSVYDGIPHLLSPVVTDPNKAVVALKWAVKEMENRYRMMASLGVRNINNYNTRVKEARKTGEKLIRNVQTGFDPETGKPIFEDQEMSTEQLPYIVVIVDEMADLMLVAGKEIEASIQRLAQMARAAGIHLIMATQRPSVDIITGVIKANFPTRISFQVTSKIDSRTIIGEQGAEQLLGMGDMLYCAGGGKPSRVHGPFISDEEVQKLVEYLKKQGEPTYIEAVTVDEEAGSNDYAAGGGDESDADKELYDRAVEIVARDRKASTSYIQRCLKIGYNRAARLIERMEQNGIVGAANHVGKREILIRKPDE